MKQILTQETANNLKKELKRLEDFMMTVTEGNDDILDDYYPHTLYEVGNILDVTVGKEIEYGDNNK